MSAGIVTTRAIEASQTIGRLCLAAGFCAIDCFPEWDGESDLVRIIFTGAVTGREFKVTLGVPSETIMLNDPFDVAVNCFQKMMADDRTCGMRIAFFN